jgi:peptidyl-prolyl cis-trans isomerase D
MSIIQTIREKGARISVILIALALVGFILTDYFSGRARGSMGGGSSSVGSVNGKSINFEEFSRKADQVEANMKQQGYPQTAALRQQAIEQTWNMEVSQLLISEEAKKLGISVGKKELGDLLYGPGAPQDLKQQFTDEKTGLYDGAKAKQQIDQMLKSKTVSQEQKDNFNSFVNQLVQERINDKFASLLVMSVNVPRWQVEKQIADNSQMASISLVREVYSSIPDSTVKIEDKEIADYISKNKELFKQEETRSIAYVLFSAAPTAADTAAILNQLKELKPEFDTTADAVSFLARNGVTNFFDGYIGKSQMQLAQKDSIQRLGKNQVFGPYLDGGSYVMAKMLEVKELPDSVKCRHILLGTQDPQTGQPIMEDSVAKKKIDSIALAIRNGANFDTLETKYSTDQAAHKDKGVMTFASSTIQSENFAKEFAQFILFDGKPGDKKVVKTNFGWHYIEILSFIKPEPHYKVAYLSREIIASQQTDGDALNAANQFAADSRDLKAFDENFEKTLKPKGMTKGLATDIRPTDAQVSVIGASRVFVRSIYEAERGEVLKPERIDNNYVVAAVTEVFNEGTQSVAKARSYVEPVLRNKKKGDMLAQKVGKVTTLEAAAAALGGKQIEKVDSLRISARSQNSAFGYEPKINGAAFNPANKGKLVPEVLKGLSGVYVVRVDNVTTTPVTDGDVVAQRKQQYEQARQYASNPQSPNHPLSGLRNAATIKDKRADRF